MVNRQPRRELADLKRFELGQRWPLLALGLVLGGFLLGPLVTLLGHGAHPQFWAQGWTDEVQLALWLSLWTSTLTVLLALLCVTPVAWMLARTSFPGQGVLEALLTLPIALPPLVAGIALLYTFGQQGPLGAVLKALGISLAFSPAAVVLAQFFVSVPFYFKTVKAGFAAVPQELEDAARLDGAGEWAVFHRVTWPLTLPFVFEGLALSWSRALGEFGATMLFAGSLPGRTRTLPLAIYAALEADVQQALLMTLVLLALTLVLLLLASRLAPRT